MAAAGSLNMSKHEVVADPDRGRFYYVEKNGPFQESAPKAWKQLHGWYATSGIGKSEVELMVGMSKLDPGAEGDAQYTYRAGFVFKNELPTVPEGVTKGIVPGGKFARYLLTGAYDQLALAYPAAIEEVKQSEDLKMRGDAFCMEVYLNEYGSVPEEELLTHIYIPV